MAAPSRYTQLLGAAVSELQRNVAAAEGAAAALVEHLLAAGPYCRIAVYGVGREGLALKGFAMRLHHMGLQVRAACSTACTAIAGGWMCLHTAMPQSVPLCRRCLPGAAPTATAMLAHAPCRRPWWAK